MKPESPRSSEEEYTNSYNELERAVADAPRSIMRSARNLEDYKRVFGETLGKDDELILDVGAGDATMADEIESLTDHKAKVIRFDMDYADIKPDGQSSAIAGDSTAMPFIDNSFDRVVSHNVMYYLGREKGVEAIAEIIRVMKPGGEASLFPAKPLTPVQSEVGHKESNSLLTLPTLIITKPKDFEEWDDARKIMVYQELAKSVTTGKLGDAIINWGMTRAIKKAATHRTVETGGKHSFKKI